MVSSTTPCVVPETSVRLDVLDMLPDVVVELEYGSDSGSDSGSYSDSDSDSGSESIQVTGTDPNLQMETGHMSSGVDPDTLPADRISEWLESIDNEQSLRPDTPHPHLEAFVGTICGNEDDIVATEVLDTCAKLLEKLEVVRLSVLHLQYTMRVGTARPLEPVSRRLWSWDHAGVFLSEQRSPGR